MQRVRRAVHGSTRRNRVGDKVANVITEVVAGDGFEGDRAVAGLLRNPPSFRDHDVAIGAGSARFCSAVAAVLTTFLIATAGVSITSTTAKPAENAEDRPATAMTVTVVNAKRMCFTNRVRVTGILAAVDEVLVRPQREGLQISQVFGEPGDIVTIGQVLARLEPLEGQPGSGIAVTAPVAGTVIGKSAMIGTMASARADPMFRIAMRGELELQGEVAARYLPKIAVGQIAKAEVFGMGEVTGRVRALGAMVDPMAQSGQVRIVFAADKRLRVGAFGRAIIEAGQSCGTAIPLTAVLYGTDGEVAQVVGGDRVETRRIRIGLISGNMVEIREGLKEGDLVIARAGSFLREGDHVRPVAVELPRPRVD